MCIPVPPQMHLTIYFRHKKTLKIVTFRVLYNGVPQRPSTFEKKDRVS
jgi:hypothetical protein